MNFLIKLIISALAVLICSYFLPGVDIVGHNFFTALIVAAVLSFLNAIVKPIMIVLTIPITIFTLGFFLLVINAFIILIAARLVDGFIVQGFWAALLFSLVLSVVTSILESIKQKDEQKNQE
jgi:putative membrane protein